MNNIPATMKIPHFVIEGDQGAISDRVRKRFIQTPNIRTAINRAIKMFNKGEGGQVTVSRAYGDFGDRPEQYGYVYRDDEYGQLRYEIVDCDLDKLIETDLVDYGDSIEVEPKEVANVG